MSQYLKIIAILKVEHPEAKCSLQFETPLQLLVATILSAQCTDARVNKITEELFKKYKTISAYANALQEDFEQDIRTAGLYRNKAKNIIRACQKIITDFNDQVPKTMSELISLPGVARKTANVVLGNAYQISDGIAVDTHVSRLSQRLGWSKETKPEKIESDLLQIIPKEEWIMISHRLIYHGRKICQAKKPSCATCCLDSLCPSAND